MPQGPLALLPALPAPTCRETQAPAKCITQAVTTDSGNGWKICRGHRGHLCSSPARPRLHRCLSQHYPGWGEGQAEGRPGCPFRAPFRSVRVWAPAAWTRFLPEFLCWTPSQVCNFLSVGLCLLICGMGRYSPPWLSVHHSASAFTGSQPAKEKQTSNRISLAELWEP